jgi:hypothetical protein
VFEDELKLNALRRKLVPFLCCLLLDSTLLCLVIAYRLVPETLTEVGEYLVRNLVDGVLVIIELCFAVPQSLYLFVIVGSYSAQLALMVR